MYHLGSDSDALLCEGSVGTNRTQALFKGNYQRLQAIKRKYDPNVVFNKWFVIDPAPA